MRRCALLFVLILTVASLWAQEEAPLPISDEEFLELVDFQTTLEGLNAAIQEDRIGDYLDKVIVVDGTVASSVVYSPDPADFYAEVELVSGRWEGLEDVLVNRAYVVMIGESFAERVPARPPREPVPGQIVANARITVAGMLYDLTTDDSGAFVPLIVAYDVRTSR